MLDTTNNKQSLSSFSRKSGSVVKQLRKSKKPMLLTIRGKAAAVVQDAEAYQRLLNIAAEASAEEGIRQGLDQARNGKGRPAKEFFAEFEAAHGLSR